MHFVSFTILAHVLRIVLCARFAVCLAVCLTACWCICLFVFLLFWVKLAAVHEAPGLLHMYSKRTIEMHGVGIVNSLQTAARAQMLSVFLLQPCAYRKNNDTVFWTSDVNGP